MVKMIVFDMAGTTVNEDNVVYKTVQWAINKRGFNFSLDQVLAQAAGKEKFQAIRSVLKTYADNDDQNLAKDIYADFVPALEQAYQSLEVKAQPGAKNLFEWLHKNNLLVVLNTGYSRSIAQSLIDKLGWKNAIEYDALVTASDVQQSRPAPDMIRFAMQQFNIDNAKEVIKVGDSIIDVEEGLNAGCAASVGITTGAHTSQQLRTANPDFVISNLKELIPIIDSFNKRY